MTTFYIDWMNFIPSWQTPLKSILTLARVWICKKLGGWHQNQAVKTISPWFSKISLFLFSDPPDFCGLLILPVLELWIHCCGRSWNWILENRGGLVPERQSCGVCVECFDHRPQGGCTGPVSWLRTHNVYSPSGYAVCSYSCWLWSLCL